MHCTFADFYHLIVDYAAQNYFEQVRSFRFPRASGNIAMTCLTYISLDVFKKLVNPEDQLELYPFLYYASIYWGYHVNEAIDQDIVDRIAEFPTQPAMNRAAQILWELEGHKPAQYVERF